MIFINQYRGYTLQPFPIKPWHSAMESLIQFIMPSANSAILDRGKQYSMPDMFNKSR